MITLPLKVAADLRDVYRYAVFAENGKVFSGVPGETMQKIFANRAAAGRLIFHRNKQGDVDGMMCWYRFNKGWTMDRVYQFDKDDEDGGEILIHAAFADTDYTRRWGIRAFLLKEPDSIWCRLRAHRERKGKRTLVDIPQKTIARLLKDGKAK